MRKTFKRKSKVAYEIAALVSLARNDSFLFSVVSIRLSEIFITYVFYYAYSG